MRRNTTTSKRWWELVEGGRTLEVRTPETPAPWYNYLFNREYTAYVSQVGQGESQCLFPNKAAVNRRQRFFYLRDRASRRFWPTLCRPAAERPDAFLCRHSLGHTEIVTRFAGVEVSHRVFVPAAGEREIWTLRVRNRSGRPRSLSLFSFFPFFDAEGTFGTVSRYEKQPGILFASKIPYFPKMDEYPRICRQKQVVAMFADVAPDAFDGSEKGFLGGDVPAATPESVRRGRLGDTSATNESNCAAFQWDFRLAKGGEFSVNLFQAAADLAGEPGIRAFRDEAAAPGYVEREFARVERFWDDQLARCRLSTPDRAFDAAANCWVRKQLCFMAYTHRMNPGPCTRNELQDLQGIALLDPPWCEENLDRVMTFQNANGYLGHSITLHPDVVLGGICVLNYKDGHMWLPPTVATYVKETGNLNYLRKVLPFKDGGEPATVAEHVRRAFAFTLADVGAHGIPLLGAGDWDDPLSGPGRRGKGESTWIAMAAMFAARQYLPVAEAAGDSAAVELLKRLIDTFDRNLNAQCWDGGWYVRGFDDDGRPFGCGRDREGRMFLNAMSWSVLAGAARGERLASVLDIIDNVFDTRCGPYTVDPPFTAVDERIGKITVKRAGTMENGSVYCHAATFKAMADCVAGRGDAAYRTLRRLFPTNPENPPETSYQPPMFIPNFYIGPHDKVGHGRASLYNSTGAAAWFFRIAAEHILGVRPEMDGLLIDPCLPRAWRKAELRRTIRGCDVTVKIANPAGAGRGVRRVTVNGRPAAGPLIPWADLKPAATVVAEMG